MTQKWKHLNKEMDIFQEILCDPKLYESIKVFKEVVELYEAKLENRNINTDHVIKTRLALMWIKMVRGTLNTKTARDELEYIEGIEKTDELTQLEHDLVRAQYVLLIDNDYMDAKSSLEQLAESLVLASQQSLPASSSVLIP